MALLKSSPKLINLKNLILIQFSFHLMRDGMCNLRGGMSSQAMNQLNLHKNSLRTMMEPKSKLHNFTMIQIKHGTSPTSMVLARCNRMCSTPFQTCSKLGKFGEKLSLIWLLIRYLKRLMLADVF